MSKQGGMAMSLLVSGGSYYYHLKREAEELENEEEK